MLFAVAMAAEISYVTQGFYRESCHEFNKIMSPTGTVVKPEISAFGIQYNPLTKGLGLTSEGELRSWCKGYSANLMALWLLPFVRLGTGTGTVVRAAVRA